jgi:hypothetical protein
MVAVEVMGGTTADLDGIYDLPSRFAANVKNASENRERTSLGAGRYPNPRGDVARTTGGHRRSAACLTCRWCHAGRRGRSN